MNTFASIFIGSRELTMKIFELSDYNKIKEIDQIRQTISLGLDIYNHNKISIAIANELCHVLSSFTQKMKEYNVDDYNARATSLFRKAKNHLLILDQIKLSSKLEVTILSNSEQRFLQYKAVILKEFGFHKLIEHGTVVVDIDAVNLQLTLFNKGAFIATSNINLGILPIYKLVSDIQNQTLHSIRLLEEYIAPNLIQFKDFYIKNLNIRNIIVVGDNVFDFIQFINYAKEQTMTTTMNYSQLQTKPVDTTISNTMDCYTFQTLYEAFLHVRTNQIYNYIPFSKEQLNYLLPTIMIYHKLLEITKSTNILTPSITLTDGIVVDYALKHKKLAMCHDFSIDSITAAREIASRYHCNIVRSIHVEDIALTLFDSLIKLHGLDTNDRLLLQLSVILMDCGKYINISTSAINSYQIVSATEIIGISHTEREIVANLILFSLEETNDIYSTRKSIDKDTYIKLCKLSAILRIANSLDISHRQKFHSIQVSYHNNQLIITGYSIDDSTLERVFFERQTDFFEEIYGIRPQLKQCRK